MEFEFDPVKSEANLQKHGIDFVQVQALWSDPKRIVVPARSMTEPRFALIARIQGDLWTCIFTIRNHRIRIISARRARNEERKGYHHR